MSRPNNTTEPSGKLQAGAEVVATAVIAKDAVGATFAANGAITVEYDSNTITNTPELEVWLEIEQ